MAAPSPDILTEIRDTQRAILERLERLEHPKPDFGLVTLEQAQAAAGMGYAEFLQFRNRNRIPTVGGKPKKVRIKDVRRGLEQESARKASGMPGAGSWKMPTEDTEARR